MGPVSSKNIIIIEPHPDDAYLGCSSVLKQGIVKKIITVTTCESGRLTETQKCAEKFKVTELECLNFEDGKVLNNLNFLEISLRNVLHFHPGEEPVVYIPSLWERHLDHKAVSFVGLMVCQAFNIKPIMYSVWDKMPNCQKIPINLSEKTKEFEELYPSQVELSEIIQPYEEFFQYSEQEIETVHWQEWLKK